MARKQQQERNYVAEMRAMVKAECVGAYRAPEKAEEIVAKLRATDPDLLIGFAQVTIVGTLRDFINLCNRTDRASARRAASRSEAREQFERALSSGDPAPLRSSSGPTLLGARFVVNDEGLQVPYGLTGKPERLYIIADYERRERWEGLHKAFHMAVQRKCRSRITQDVYSEDELAALHRSIVGEAA